MDRVPDREIKSYVLRTGRMSKLQKQALEKLSGKYVVKFKNEYLNIHELFHNNNDLILEIGFGMGSSTAEIAEKNPDKNYIGIEVYSPGVGKLLSLIDIKRLKNIKIISYDAVSVVRYMIPDNSLTGVHIFFPDPWPKKKHNKRRLINEIFISLLLPKIKTGGYLYITTDWEPYALWILEVLGRFEMLHNPFHPFAGEISWRPVTSYEQKGKDKNHIIRNIWFEKQ